MGKKLSGQITIDVWKANETIGSFKKMLKKYLQKQDIPED